MKNEWKVLIVDDEPDVHALSSIILKDVIFEGKPIKLISAYSANEAKEILKKENEIALAIIDIVMENEKSGFDLIHFIRNELKNELMRIVVRTGQPGYAPPREVILKYDINDYRDKSTLTSNELYTTVIARLREYSDILELYTQREILKEFTMSNTTNISDLNIFLEKINKILQKNISKNISIININNDKCYENNQIFWNDKNKIEFFIKHDDKKCLKYTLTFDTPIKENYKNLLNLILSTQLLNIKNNILSKELIDNLYEIIYILSEITETRSLETGEHVKRVGKTTKIIAKNLEFDKKDLEYIETAAMLHDIGKIGIPDNILNKPGKLNDDEWEIMKNHTIIGYKILSSVNNPLFKMAANIALNHHENWDGSGYPNGLKGEEIPLEARIVSIVDVYDALSSDRVYRKAWSKEKVLDFIKKNKGIKFDPKIVQVFFDNYEEIKQIYNK